jgi:hypothetical protein
MWLGERVREPALSMARDAFRVWRGCDDALRLIREVHGKRSPKAKYYRLLIAGSNFAPDNSGETLSFFTSYDVVAESPEAALEFIKELEPEAIGETLLIEKCKKIEPRSVEPMGVHRTSGLACYSDEQSE